jgi:hypothetical protein
MAPTSKSAEPGLDRPSRSENTPNTNAKTAKLTMKPRAIMSGRIPPFLPTEAANKIGRVGNTQGAAMVRTPAANAMNIVQHAERVKSS